MKELNHIKQTSLFQISEDIFGKEARGLVKLNLLFFKQLTFYAFTINWGLRIRRIFSLRYEVFRCGRTEENCCVF